MRHMKSPTIVTNLLILAVALCGLYVAFVAISAWMVSRDREDCKQHLQDNTTRGQEYGACLRLLS